MRRSPANSTHRSLAAFGKLQHIRADFQLPQLTLDNAAVRVGAAPQGARYSVRWSVLDNLSGREQPWGKVELEGARAGVAQAAWGPPTMWATDIPSRPFAPSIRTTRTGRSRLS